MKITKRQLRRIIKEAKVALLKEQYDRDPSPGYDYDPDSDPAQRAQADMEQMQYEEYKAWAKETGQVTPASSSVMATYFLEQELTDDEEQIDMMASGYGIDPEDVMRDIRRQQAEYDAGGVLSDEEDFERGFKNQTMKLDLKTLLVLAGIAVTFGGFYYGTEYRLSSLEQEVEIVKEKNSSLKVQVQKLAKRIKNLHK